MAARSANSGLAIILTLTALLGFTVPAGAQVLRWTAKKPMPVPRVFFGAAAVQGKIYAIGGYSGSTLSRVDVYDPATDSWSSRQPMPTARALAITAVVNGKIYVIGGGRFETVNDLTYTVANEAYDPAGDTWEHKADLPFAPPLEDFIENAFLGGTAVGGKIYVAVFRRGTTATWVYDPVADTWDTSRAPVPFSYTNYSAAGLNGKLYVAAIRDAPWGGPFSFGASLGEYNPAANSWVIRKPTPSVRSAFALTASGGMLYAVGGAEVDHVEPEETFFRPVGTVEAFNPATNQWTVKSPLPTPRLYPAVVALNDQIYALGGGLRPSNDAPVVVPLDDVEVATLSPGGCAPDGTTLCLDDEAGDGRFQITVSYATSQGGGLSGNAGAVPLSPLAIDRGGVFWFFSRENPEMLVKVLNGCASNGYFWVFSSAGTNVGFTLRVRDTKTGKDFTRTNPDLHAAPPVQEVKALACQ
jgi:hypothetical protein